MPRYFFNIRDGDTLIEDTEGSELPDLDHARVDAVHSARDLLAERVKNGQVVDGQKFEICDEQGRILAVVAFKDAIKMT